MPKTPHSSWNLSNIIGFSAASCLSARGLRAVILFSIAVAHACSASATGMSIAACPFTLSRIALAADPCRSRAPARRPPSPPPSPRRDAGSRTDTTMRDADSPNSVALTAKPRRRSGRRRADAAVTSALTPMPPVSNVHSASATARPPSEQSCADSTQPSRISLTISACSAASRFEVERRRRARHHAVHASRGIRCRRARLDYRPAGPPRRRPS